MSKKHIGFLLAIGMLFVGCGANNPQPVKQEVKPILTEEGVVEEAKCLDKKCNMQKLTIKLVQEHTNVTIKVNSKNKKYKPGDLILIKIK